MINKISKLILFIVLPITILLQSLSFCVFHTHFFEKKMKENNLEIITGIESEKLLNIYDEILKYLKGDRADLMIFEKVDGKTEQIFEERELSHMEDVKVLFDYGFMIRNICVVLICMIAIYLFFKDKKGLCKTIFFSGITSIIILSMIGIFMLVDFTRIFTIFHELLFTNDLWLLDPRTDILILMLPLNFFVDLGFKILLTYLVIMIILISISFICWKKGVYE